MLPAAEIRLFNPFSLQYGANQTLSPFIQTVINYAESRFRAALPAIQLRDRNLANRKWMQTLLQKEIVRKLMSIWILDYNNNNNNTYQMYVMSLIGIAAAVGQIIDIPIVCRSLADALVLADPDTLPLDIGEHLLSFLGTESSYDEGHPNCVVRTYQCQWWQWRRPPTSHLDTAILGPDTVDDCLSHYRDMVNQARVRADITPIAKPLPTMAEAAMFAAAPADEHMCASCNYARVTCAELLDKLRQAENFAAAMKSASTAQADLARRDIAGAHLFGETVLLKETDPRNASTPAESQWQFGASLSREEVLTLNISGAPNNHDGYNMSLPSGPLPHTNSSGGSAGTAAAADFSSVGSRVNIPPSPTHHQFPPHFLRGVGETKSSLSSAFPPHHSAEAPTIIPLQRDTVGRRAPAREIFEVSDSEDDGPMVTVGRQAPARQIFEVSDSEDEGPRGTIGRRAPAREVFELSDSDEECTRPVQVSSQGAPPRNTFALSDSDNDKQKSHAPPNHMLGRASFAASDSDEPGNDQGRLAFQDSKVEGKLSANLSRGRAAFADSDDEMPDAPPDSGNEADADVRRPNAADGRNCFGTDSDDDIADASDNDGRFPEDNFDDLDDSFFVSPAGSDSDGA